MSAASNAAPTTSAIKSDVRNPVQVPITRVSQPTSSATATTKALQKVEDEEVVEIRTPAARMADDIIDADRDKVFDFLFEAQEKAEESLMQQVRGQLMITGPPSEAQAEQMQRQAEQRFLRIPLEKVWAEFAKQHHGQAITKDEHCELVRCFITANKRWSTTKNEEGKQQMMMEASSMGLPPGLVHMMTAMTENLVGGIEQTLYEKMSSNYQLIAGAVWAQLGKDSNGCVTKKAFTEKFLDVFSDVVDKGMEKALESGELDAALGPLAGNGPVIMMAAIPMDMEEMLMGSMGMGMGGPMMIGAPPGAHLHSAHSQGSGGYSQGYPQGYSQSGSYGGAYLSAHGRSAAPQPSPYNGAGYGSPQYGGGAQYSSGATSYGAGGYGASYGAAPSYTASYGGGAVYGGYR